MNYIEDALGETPLFARMSGLELNAVSAFLERRRYPRGAIVFKEGDRGEEMFIVLKGRVGSFLTQSDGTRRKLYSFETGRFFGEMSIIEGVPRSATCWAEEDSELLSLQAIDFYRLVFEHPMIALKLLSAIGNVMTSWLDESSRFLNDLVRWGETARRRAVTDELTGLYNRRFLEESMTNRFEMGSINRRSMALAMLDLDRVHLVNERCGTKAGDQLIAAIGGIFREALRDGDIAARLSGDEFAFLLPDTDLEDAFAVAERLRVCVENFRCKVKRECDGVSVIVSIRASVGVASAPEHAEDSAALMAAADAALRKAKQDGRNRVVCADSASKETRSQ